MISSYALVMLLFLTLESVTAVPTPQPAAACPPPCVVYVLSYSVAGSGQDWCILASQVLPFPLKLPCTNVWQRLEPKVTGL